MIPFDLDLSLIGKEAGKLQGKLSENGITYHIDPKYKEGKERVYYYMSKMVASFFKLAKFDAVMSGNYIYIDQQEFFRVCEEKNAPSIILNKEGMGAYMLPEDGWVGSKGLRFVGAKMLLVNDIYKRLELKNIKGFEERHAITVGLPRFDYYFNSPRRYLKQVVFFGFILDEYLGNWQLVDEQITTNLEKLEDISEIFYKNVIDFAIKHPDYKVIIKAKNAAIRYMKYPFDILRKHFNNMGIENLEITGNADVKKLILDSCTILGYNSTVLFEALLVDKMIVSPYFGHLLPTYIKGDYFYNDPDLVNYANQYDELEKMILNYKNYKPPSVERKKEFLEPLLFRIDGKSSQRAEKAIIDIIEEYKDNYMTFGHL